MATRWLKLTVAYDGTNYAGWQIQPDKPTVQAAIEAAWHEITHETVRVTAAGRTDAGVHALGQVVAVATESRLPVSDLQRGLNAVLPEDVAVVALEEACEGFHATYDALGKTYRYQIHNGRVPAIFDRRYTWHYPQPLDAESMHAAAQALVGQARLLELRVDRFGAADFGADDHRAFGSPRHERSRGSSDDRSYRRRLLVQHGARDRRHAGRSRPGRTGCRLAGRSARRLRSHSRRPNRAATGIVSGARRVLTLPQHLPVTLATGASCRALGPRRCSSGRRRRGRSSSPPEILIWRGGRGCGWVCRRGRRLRCHRI